MLPVFENSDISNYYRKLLLLKENGYEFSWKNISYDELRFLSWEVNLTDGRIAEIYDSNKKAVCAKRGKWNLQLRFKGVNEFFYGYTWYLTRDDEFYSLEESSKRDFISDLLAFHP